MVRWGRPMGARQIGRLSATEAGRLSSLHASPTPARQRHRWAARVNILAAPPAARVRDPSWRQFLAAPSPALHSHSQGRPMKIGGGGRNEWAPPAWRVGAELAARLAAHSCKLPAGAPHSQRPCNKITQHAHADRLRGPPKASSPAQPAESKRVAADRDEQDKWAQRAAPACRRRRLSRRAAPAERLIAGLAWAGPGRTSARAGKIKSASGLAKVIWQHHNWWPASTRRPHQAQARVRAGGAG